MEALHIARTLRRWAWLIVLFAVIAGITAAAVSYELPKQYQTRTTALVNPKQLPLPTSSTSGGFVSTDQLVQTYVQLINATPVQDKLIADGVPRTEEELNGELHATDRTNTTLIDITIQDRDPVVAERIAEDIVPALNASLEQLQTKAAGADTSTPRLDALVPWQVPTKAPTTPVSPRPLINTLVAVLAAIAVATGLAFFLEYLDNTVRSELDVHLRLQLPLLGPVPYQRRTRTVRPSREAVALVTLTHPKDPMSEAYRAIRTNLIFNSVDKKLRTVVVTSAIPGEGKTSTACNLAVTMAQAGNKVILVDADFRRPELHRLFHRRNDTGLGNLFLGQLAEEELAVPTVIDNLSLVSSGASPPNPSELLGSQRMATIIEHLKDRADLVIFDTPPVGAVTDATVLAAQTDGVILVVERGRTNITTIERASKTLAGVRANVLGVVLNKVRASEAAEYYYYRYYGQPGTKNGGNGKGGLRSPRRETEAIADAWTKYGPQPKPAAQPPTEGQRRLEAGRKPAPTTTSSEATPTPPVVAPPPTAAAESAARPMATPAPAPIRSDELPLATEPEFNGNTPFADGPGTSPES